MEEIKGRIKYEDLRRIIFNHVKNNQNLELSSTSIDNLKQKLTGDNGWNGGPFFIVKAEFGETRFDISKEDIQKMLKSFLASRNYELSNIEYGEYVDFTYVENHNINTKKEEKANLDITYDGMIEYKELRQIILNYYKEKKGIELMTMSIGYLKDKLRGEVTSYPFFTYRDEFGEKSFDIPNEEIQEIFRNYLASKNYELEELIFDDKVTFKYKQKKNKDLNNSIEGPQINEYGEIIRNGESKATNIVEDVPQFTPPKGPGVDEVNAKAGLGKSIETKKVEPVLVKDVELEKTERERRRFSILRRERSMNEAKKGKTTSAIVAGLCMLGATVAVLFNGQDASKILQDELNAVYSWEALGQYIKDIGPLTTLLAAGTGSFIAKYFKHSKKLKQAQQEFEDFNNSLENDYDKNLGGTENAKSR